jgi:hypothetical protein
VTNISLPSWLSSPFVDDLRLVVLLPLLQDVSSNKLWRKAQMKQTRICLLLAALLFVLLSIGQRVAQSPVPVTLVKAGRLLDPRTGNVLSPAAVLSEDGKIKEVGPPSRVQADAPAGVKSIDLGSATLLPGLIDSHTHLLLDVTVPTEENNEIPKCMPIAGTIL